MVESNLIGVKGGLGRQMCRGKGYDTILDKLGEHSCGRNQQARKPIRYSRRLLRETQVERDRNRKATDKVKKKQM